MKDDEMQRLWDSLIINGWKYNASTGRIFIGFIKQAAPILGKLNDWDRSYAFFDNHIKIRKIGRFELNQPVSAFVNNHSPQLSNYLWDADFDVTKVVINIANFKWFKERRKSKRHSAMKSSYKKILQSTRFISARAGDKRHDWATVK